MIANCEGGPILSAQCYASVSQQIREVLGRLHANVAKRLAGWPAHFTRGSRVARAFPHIRFEEGDFWTLLTPSSISVKYASPLQDKMSSPASRRSNRNSVNGTPRRNTQNAELPKSDASLPDADAANDQLQSEANQASQQETPRASARLSQIESQSQAPPTSSPLFFRSSPRDSQSQSQSQSLQPPAAHGINGSSPLRQQLDAGSSQGGRTPRASGGIGGKMLQDFVLDVMRD